MSSKDQEILRLQAELATLQAEQHKLEEIKCKFEEMGRQLEDEQKKLAAAKSVISNLEADSQNKQKTIDHMQSIYLQSINVNKLIHSMSWLLQRG